MVPSDKKELNIKIQPTTSTSNVGVTNNLAHYYEELAKEHKENAKISEDNAHVWAEGTDGEVLPLGGVHSSKGWANLARETVENSITNIQNQEHLSLEALTNQETLSLSNLDNEETSILNAIGQVKTEGISAIGVTLTNAQKTLNNELTNDLAELTNKKDTYIGNIKTEKDNSISAIQTQKTTTINEVKAEGTKQKQELQPYVTQAQTYADNSKSSADNSLKYAKDSEYWANQSAKGQIQADWTEDDIEAKSYILNKPDLSTKQDVITDLVNIRDGASKGATALQTVPDTYATKTYVTSQGYITSSYHDSTKQDTLNITLLEGAEQW